MRTQGIKSGFGASSHLSTSNKDLHEFLTAYVRDVECKWTPDYLGPIVEAMNHVIREKPRLPLQTSHMSITKTIEHGMVCEKICIVVTAPGGKVSSFLLLAYLSFCTTNCWDSIDYFNSSC